VRVAGSLGISAKMALGAGVAAAAVGGANTAGLLPAPVEHVVDDVVHAVTPGPRPTTPPTREMPGADRGASSTTSSPDSPVTTTALVDSRRSGTGTAGAPTTVPAADGTPAPRGPAPGGTAPTAPGPAGPGSSPSPNSDDKAANADDKAANADDKAANADDTAANAGDKAANGGSPDPAVSSRSDNAGQTPSVGRSPTAPPADPGPPKDPGPPTDPGPQAPRGRGRGLG
jgi:hypothetical protein